MLDLWTSIFANVYIHYSSLIFSVIPFLWYQSVIFVFNVRYPHMLYHMKYLPSIFAHLGLTIYHLHMLHQVPRVGEAKGAVAALKVRRGSSIRARLRNESKYFKYVILDILDVWYLIFWMCNIRYSKYSKLKNRNICTEGTAEVFYLRINFTLLLNTALKNREEDEEQFKDNHLHDLYVTGN